MHIGMSVFVPPVHFIKEIKKDSKAGRIKWAVKSVENILRFGVLLKNLLVDFLG